MDYFYAIFSPSRNAWLNSYSEYGLCSQAEHFPEKDWTITLEDDQRWVGPIVDGEYP